MYKAWWIVPIILMLIFIGVIVVFGQAGTESPFSYLAFFDKR